MRRFAVLALCAACLALDGCSIGTASFMAPLGRIASEQRRWFFETILWMLIVVGPVVVLTPLWAWRYRHGRKNAAFRPDWGSASLPYEIAIWGPPLVIVGVLSWLVCGPQTRIDPFRPLPGKAPIDVQVVALNWKWLFIYPKQGIATVGTLAFPADHQLSLQLTSDATMQSFFIPALGSQIYAMAGMVTRLHLAAAHPATAAGENTQFNGVGFQDDRFQVRVLPPSEFDAWVATVKSHGIALDASSYVILHKDGTAQQARARLQATGAPPQDVWFSSVPHDFFRKIVAQAGTPHGQGMPAMAADGG